MDTFLDPEKYGSQAAFPSSADECAALSALSTLRNYGHALSFSLPIFILHYKTIYLWVIEEVSL